MYGGRGQEIFSNRWRINPQAARLRWRKGWKASEWIRLLASSINFTDEQSQPSDGPTNMARDCDLLANAEKGQPGCRVYDWDGPWISLGFNQNPQEDLLNPDLVPWVMRPTGGKAVLHGNDVTVGLALPLSAPSRSIKSAYRAIAQPLIHALN